MRGRRAIRREAKLHPASEHKLDSTRVSTIVINDELYDLPTRYLFPYKTPPFSSEKRKERIRLLFLSLIGFNVKETMQHEQEASRTVVFTRYNGEPNEQGA